MSLLVAETYPSAAYRTVPLFLGNLAAISPGFTAFSSIMNMLYTFISHITYNAEP